MRPKERRDSGQNDFFRARLDQIVDLDHALAKLGRAIDWRFLEQRFGAVYSDKVGHPPLPTRLMAGLAILKPMHDLSDEDLCARRIKNPDYQLFCGEEVFQHKLTFDRSSLTRWRRAHGRGAACRADPGEPCGRHAHRRGEAGRFFQGHRRYDRAAKGGRFSEPTPGSMHRARERLAKLAKKTGVELRQSYHRVGKHALIAHQRYAHSAAKRIAFAILWPSSSSAPTGRSGRSAPISAGSCATSCARSKARLNWRASSLIR